MKTRHLLAAILAVACSQPASAKGVLAADRPETQASATFTVTSRDFKAGGEIPKKFTDYDIGMSPSLVWKGVPEGTKSLAVIMEDPDASTSQPFLHWLGWNIDPAAGLIERGSVTLGARLGRNGRGNPAYFGPRPPGKTPHKYHFQMFALDAQLPLKAGASREQLLQAMKGHVLAKASLVGTFAKP
ncbi:MAG TPA: YbhB/YbcL family Raf kinase inhibitor-like protein [Allosphingosinicella sp.]|jgi:Raf kinase inhibitor-like YbhB/YbcL family protein